MQYLIKNGDLIDDLSNSSNHPNDRQRLLNNNFKETTKEKMKDKILKLTKINIFKMMLGNIKNTKTISKLHKI